MNQEQLKNIIEAALMTSARPLSVDNLLGLFGSDDQSPGRDEIRAILDGLTEDYAQRGIELKQVSSGYRIQARQDMAPWINRLNEEKAPRYSRALLETLALIAYRQPITRAGVEDVRGVSVSSSIIRTLLEREWIRVVGHRDVPGKPALYGTTRQFLDYFNLKSLSDLPPLSELRNIEQIQEELVLKMEESSSMESGEQAVTPAETAAMEHQEDTDDGRNRPAEETNAADEENVLSASTA